MDESELLALVQAYKDACAMCRDIWQLHDDGIASRERALRADDAAHGAGQRLLEFIAGDM